MTLCDSSALIALLSKSDRNHDRCTLTARGLSGPLVTTWLCLTETMYFLGRYKGWAGQDTLWAYVESQALLLYDLTERDRRRMRILMSQYRDTPMDVADASLVATAEALDRRVIFTLDSDFYVYRLRDIDSFQVIPN